MNRPDNHYLSIIAEPVTAPGLNKKVFKVTLNDDDHARNKWPYMIIDTTEDLRKFAKALMDSADMIDKEVADEKKKAEAKTAEEPSKPAKLKKVEAKEEQPSAPA